MLINAYKVTVGWCKSNPYILALFCFIVLVLGIFIIIGLTKVQQKYRRKIIGGVVFISGLYYAMEYFWPAKQDNNQSNFLTPYLDAFIMPWSSAISGLLLGVGLFSIASIHVRSASKRKEGWIASIALLTSIVVMGVFTYLSTIPNYSVRWVMDTFDCLYDGLYQNLDSAMFSTVAFYILSAAYRAFRIRSVESSILMISALVVMLGLSFGTLITGTLPESGFGSNFRIETISNWTLAVLSAPALRGIEFGLGIGGLAMALRLWLSIERGAIFGD